MLWKFNNLLLSDNISKEKLKQHIQNIENDSELSKASTIAQKKMYMSMYVLTYKERYKRKRTFKKQRQGKLVSSFL